MKPTRYYSDKSEKQGAKTLGMKQQPNSGATPFMKGDLIDKYTLLDDKTVTKVQQSISLKKSWFEKIKEEMFSMGRRFCGIRFNYGDPRKSYVALPEDDFNELYKAWKELYGGD